MTASIRARRIAALAADGVDDEALAAVSRTLSSRGATVQLVAPRPGCVRTSHGVELRVDHSLITARAAEFDAVFVPDGERSVRELRWDPRAWVFLTEACERGRAILALGLGAMLFDAGPDDRLAVAKGRHVTFAPAGTRFDATLAFIETLARESRERAQRLPALAAAAVL